LEAFKNFNDSLNHLSKRLEPEKTVIDSEQKFSFEDVRPLLCGLVDEVRTNLKEKTQYG
jgi:hypothetical protein